MIKANELRIGNWVSLDLNHSDTSEFQIELADLNLIATDKNRNYNPIQLTEELLVKLGFDSLYISDNGITFRFEKIGSDWICHIDDSIIMKIQYVHTLQNLYFALTGQELIIKN